MALTQALGLNDLGDVVGVSSPANPNFNQIATLWRNGQPTSLGMAPNGNYSYASAINNQGQICGEADDGDIRPLACIFSNGEAQIIDTGGNNSRGIFISETGEIIGNYARGFGTTWLPTMWSEDPNHPGRYDQTFFELFEDPIGNFAYNYALGANNSLVTVGQVSSILWSARAGLWRNDANHSLTLMQPLPDYWSCYAYGINDAGIAVGVSDMGVSRDTPTVWLPNNPATPVALPLFLGETHGMAFAINNRGEVIGTHANGLPAFWRGGKIFDLMQSLDQSSAGWTDLSLSDINNRGEIVGVGKKNGVDKGFILKPLATVGIQPR